uniref:TOG domain-containing protein n=1 Tax=Spongospora subterranea TaxID=70186 RepID=A0A0H5RNR3_9EUKA|eukprot:CRZ10369.1 hypothetical protein [Spongospora subterranea]
MEEIRLLLTDQEAKSKIKGMDLLTLALDSSPMKFEDPGVASLLKPLRNMMKDNNAKIAESALRIMCSLVHRHGPASRSYFSASFDAVVDCLGGSKTAVRTQAINLVMQFMIDCGDAVLVWDCLHKQSLQAKNGIVRHSALVCYQKGMDHFGANFIPLVKIIPYLLQLMDDQILSVRELCLQCIATLYRNIGPDLYTYLSTNANLRHAQLKIIDQLIQNVDIVPLEQRLSVDWGLLPDKSSGAVASNKRTTGVNDDNASDALDMPLDIRPSLISSDRELESEMDSIVDILKDNKHNWQVRINTLKKLASIVMGPARNLSSFLSHLKRCTSGLIVQAHELRSAVAKETCIILAAISKTLGHDFSPVADVVLPELLKLTFTSIQVVSTAADFCIRTIISHTRVNTAIRKILNLAKGKNPALRATAMEYVSVLLSATSTEMFDRYSDVILDQIRLSLSDANENARQAARVCYWALQSHWPSRAQQLSETLDAGIQKLLLHSASECTVPQRPVPKTRRRSGQFPSHSSTSIIKDKENDNREVTLNINGDSCNGAAASRNLLQSRSMPVSGGALRILKPDIENVNVSLHASRTQVADQLVAKPQRAERRLQNPRCNPAPLMTTAAPESRKVVTTFDGAVALLSSKEWADRVHAFEFLTSNIDLCHGQDPQRIACLFQQHINDAQVKVASSCLDTMVRFLSDASSASIRSCIVKALSQLLLASINADEPIFSSCNRCIELFIERADVYELIPELLRVLLYPTARLQDTALNMMLNILESRIQDAIAYFSDAQRLRMALAKLRTFVSVRKPETHETLSQILELLSEAIPSLFEDQILQLPLPEQVMIRKLFGNDALPTSNSCDEDVNEHDPHSDESDHAVANSSQPLLDDDKSRLASEIGNKPLQSGKTVEAYCPNVYESPTDSDVSVLALAEQLSGSLSQKQASQCLREISVQIGLRNTPVSTAGMIRLFSSMLQALQLFASCHDIHVYVVHATHDLLAHQAEREIISPCFSIVFDVLFALRQVERVSAFEEAARSFDFGDCIGVIESKLCAADTSKGDLVTTIEFISYLFVSLPHEQSAVRWALHRIIPLLPAMLKHKEIDVRKSCVFCIVDLYSTLGQVFLSPLWPLLEPTQLKLMTVFIDKRGLPLPNVEPVV